MERTYYQHGERRTLEEVEGVVAVRASDEDGAQHVLGPETDAAALEVPGETLEAFHRAGWRFVRVRGTRFYRDPDSAMAWVLGELRRLGIQPVGPAVQASPGTAAQLREAVVRRAWEIMRERGWIQSPESA